MNLRMWSLISFPPGKQQNAIFTHACNVTASGKLNQARTQAVKFGDSELIESGDSVKELDLGRYMVQATPREDEPDHPDDPAFCLHAAVAISEELDSSSVAVSA